MHSASKVMLAVLALTVLAALAVSSPAAAGSRLLGQGTGGGYHHDRAARAPGPRIHRCEIDYSFRGFPSVTALRARRVGCQEARGAARWIWLRVHRDAGHGEEPELPEVVGPVRRRTFICRYRSVEDAGNFLHYAARCSSGRAVVRLHLGS